MWLSDLTEEWCELLDSSDSWSPWLSKRMEDLTGEEGAVVVLLFDPRTDAFVPFLRPSNRVSENNRPSLYSISCKSAGALAEVFRSNERAVLHDGDVPEVFLENFASLVAAPLCIEGEVTGVTAFGSQGEERYATGLLSEWTKAIGEGLALRLIRIRQRADHSWRLGMLGEMSSNGVYRDETLISLLRRGFTDHPFRVVGSVSLEEGIHSMPDTVRALELRDHPSEQRRLAPVALPMIGDLLRRTLNAGKTVYITEKTRSLYLRDAPELANFMDTRGLTAGVFSPILLDRISSGAVLVLSDKNSLSDEAIGRVEELAAMAGVTLNYHFSSTEAVRNVGHMKQKLEESHRLDGQVSDLIQHVLSEGSLHDLTQRLAQQVETPLLVESASFESLSFAWPTGMPNISLDERDRLILSGAIRDFEAHYGTQSAPKDAPHYIELPEAFPYAAVRVVMPIRVDGEIAGYLSSLRNDRRPDAEADHRLTFAAAFVGLHMIRRQTAEEVRYRLSGDLINDLIGGQRDESIISRIRRLDYDLTPPFFVVGLTWHQNRQTATNPSVRMVMGLTADVVSRQYQGALIGERDSCILFALSVEDERKVEDTARRVISAIQNTFSGTTASACISQRCTRLWDIETAYTEARKVLRLYEDLGGAGKVVSVRHLGSYTALLQTDNIKELHDFALGWLRPLLIYDAEKESELVPTLHAYLRNWGHQGNTAEECSIHVSTLKYRLKRIKDIGDLDLSDPETRTQAQLACQVLHAINVLHKTDQ